MLSLPHHFKDNSLMMSEKMNFKWEVITRLVFDFKNWQKDSNLSGSINRFTSHGSFMECCVTPQVPLINASEK